MGAEPMVVPIGLSGRSVPIGLSGSGCTHRPFRQVVQLAHAMHHYKL